MDRQKEIALALSACPPSVATKAAVYVLDKSGYVKARDSQNGFMAIVQHSLPISQEPHAAIVTSLSAVAIVGMRSASQIADTISHNTRTFRDCRFW
jgi:hypothetical protein